MALFKKPKKNVSRRVSSVDISEEDTATSPNISDSKSSKGKPKVGKSKKHLLSFEEELNEDEDTFQVKKSIYSKRLAKSLNKERLKKKGSENEKCEPKHEMSEQKIGSANCSDVKSDVGQTNYSDILKPVEDIEGTSRHKSARKSKCNPKSDHYLRLTSEDLSCNYNSSNSFPDLELSVEDISSEDELYPKCPETDRLKIFLQCGQIPDASAIHAARKRRQMAREVKGEPVCMSLKTSPEIKSRPITFKRSSWEMNETQFGQIKQSYIDEETQWESQQLKKAVSKGQLEAICKEYSAERHLGEMSSNVSNDYFVVTNESKVSLPSNGTSASMVDAMRNSLMKMKDTHTENCLKLDQMNTALEEYEETCEKCENERPLLEKKLRFYQDLRYYLLNLTELYNVKLPMIEGLEKRFCHLLKKRSLVIMERRRQDVRDETEEQSAFQKGSSKKDVREEEARVRRGAEREGRRARRRRSRAQHSVCGHAEGMSSDDEITETDQENFESKITALEKASRDVWDDVVEEYCSLPRVLKHFEDWFVSYGDDFREAYVGLCLPKILGPMIRVTIMTWNPLLESKDLDDYDWFRCISNFGEKLGFESPSVNSEFDLACAVVDKVVLQKLYQVVDAAWDPMSTSQNLRIVGLINKFTSRYPALTESSKRLKSLEDLALEKMHSAIASDVSIPLRTLQGRVALFERQFSSALKLLRNMISWHGIVGNRALHDVAVGMLLNRYLLTALRACAPRDAVRLSGMIVTIFPRAWFHHDAERPPLELFVTLLKTVSSSLTGDSASLEAVERLIAELDGKNN